MGIAWYRANRQRAIAWQMAYHRDRPWIRKNAADKMKQRLADYLGGCCAFCGETDRVVLEFDHRAPLLRSDEKRAMGRTGPGHLMSALRKGTENPFNLQVVCANCHARKTAMERAEEGRLSRDN